MDSRNPALSSKRLEQIRSFDDEGVMTLRGAATKAAILTAALIASACYTWLRVSSYGAANIQGLLLTSVFGGFAIALATIFMPRIAPYSAPLYAVLQGLAVGGIAAMLEPYYPGIAMQAAALTFGVLAIMLVLYSTGMIRASEKFRSVIVTAMMGIVAYYILGLLFSFVGLTLPLLHDNGAAGIAFGLFVCGVAGFSLILDFDAMERAARAGAPKYYEWYAAFGLLVGLIWLYIELLRLLLRIRSRN